MPQANVKPSTNPADYEAVARWYRSSGGYYVGERQDQAARERAPLDAIYRDDDGRWHLARELAVDHPFRLEFEQRYGFLAHLEGAATNSHLARDLAPPAARVALDFVTKRHSAFKSFEQLITAALFHGYTPTIRCNWFSDRFESGERAVLADAFDAAMEAANSSIRAHRS